MVLSTTQKACGVSDTDSDILDAQKRSMETISRTYPNGVKLSIPLTAFAFSSMGEGNAWRKEILTECRSSGLSLFVLEIPGHGKSHGVVENNVDALLVEIYPGSSPEYLSGLDNPNFTGDIKAALRDILPRNNRTQDSIEMFLENARNYAQEYGKNTQSETLDRFGAVTHYTGDGEYTESLREFVSTVKDICESDVLSVEALTNSLYNCKSDLVRAPREFYSDVSRLIEKRLSTSIPDIKDTNLGSLAASLIIGASVGAYAEGIGSVRNAHIMGLPDFSTPGNISSGTSAQNQADAMKGIAELLKKGNFRSLFSSEDSQRHQEFWGVQHLTNMHNAAPDVMEAAALYAVISPKFYGEFFETSRSPLSIRTTPSELVSLQNKHFACARNMGADKEAFSITLKKAILSSTVPFYSAETYGILGGGKVGYTDTMAQGVINEVRNNVSVMTEKSFLQDSGMLRFHAGRGVNALVGNGEILDRNMAPDRTFEV